MEEIRKGWRVWGRVGRDGWESILMDVETCALAIDRERER